ncbi:hypothetical protein [Aquihabitans sp. McL0605]|uniref:aldose epimerase family protein n=1 Tax=Aquihabitans sp. McL0605 TaxID=3415671 RepID=UPI003CE8DEA8
MSELTLRAGEASASVYPEHGGRLGQLDLGGGPLLRPRSGEGWIDWGCYPLVPWSNRIPGGHLRWGDIDDQLPVNSEDGAAIHGLVAACPWTVLDQAESSAHLEVVVAAGPYRIRAAQTFDLEPDRLGLQLSAENEGEVPVPVGIGIHPWFHRGRVQLAAEERWPGEPIPTGPPVPVEGRYDLRQGVVPAPMDACFTTLTAPVAEVPGARLRWDGPISNVVVYTGEPDWVCVEPVTMATNGFELARAGAPHHGVQVLEPGAAIEVGYRFERANLQPPR